MAKRAAPKAKPRNARRLTSGLYSWRGRRVKFSKLPKKQKSLIRSRAAKKGNKTKRARKLAAVQVRAPLKTVRKVEQGAKRGSLVFTHEKTANETNEMVVRAIVSRHLAEFPTADRFSWSARLWWPNDPRGEPGKPYMNTISNPVRADPLFASQQIVARLDQTEELGGSNLERGGSQGLGRKVVVHSISLLC